MNNKASAKANTLIWMLMQIQLDQFDPSIVKGAHPVSDSNLDCEKVCMDCANGDTIEFSVDDEDNKVYVRFTLEQVKTKGKLVYHIPKWPDEFESSQLSAYIAKLMYIIKDVYAMYKNCTFVTKCTWCTHDK